MHFEEGFANRGIDLSVSAGVLWDIHKRDWHVADREVAEASGVGRGGPWDHTLNPGKLGWWGTKDQLLAA